MFGKTKEKTEILVIANRYKDTLKDLIDSSNIESLIILRPVGKKLCNIMANLKDPSTESELNNLTESKLVEDYSDGSPQRQ